MLVLFKLIIKSFTSKQKFKLVSNADKICKQYFKDITMLKQYREIICVKIYESI